MQAMLKSHITAKDRLDDLQVCLLLQFHATPRGLPFQAATLLDLPCYFASSPTPFIIGMASREKLEGAKTKGVKRLGSRGRAPSMQRDAAKMSSSMRK